MIDNDNKIDNTVSLQILKTMLSFVDIDFTNIEKLIGNEIDRDCFLETDVIEKFKCGETIDDGEEIKIKGPLPARFYLLPNQLINELYKSNTAILTYTPFFICSK